jgi:2-oxoglutarate dehydrogenase E2 component (dihydrolipoamide succinyltransferase)
MADYNVLLPKLGESVQEGTITKLFVKEGDIIKEDDPLFELATDKVDSEIPSPVAGKVKEIRCAENEIYPVGQVIMIISVGEAEPIKNSTDESASADKKTSSDSSKEFAAQSEATKQSEPTHPEQVAEQSPKDENQPIKSSTDENAPAGKKTSSDSSKEFAAQSEATEKTKTTHSEQVAEQSPKDENHEPDRFYSPLVMSIAAREGISPEELNTITGSGLGGRVQKNDITAYVEQHQQIKKEGSSQSSSLETDKSIPESQSEKPKVSISIGAEDTIVKMDRIRKLIANHMIMSKEVSAHVTTVVEADVTNIALWRNKVKEQFLAKYDEKLTYLPIFTEAVAKALSEYRDVNVSVDGENIIQRKHINIGIAVAKDDGNLVVPVIKDADTKNLHGLAKDINGLSNAARTNKLIPDQLQDGTFSITNFGTFGNLMGTPIINQPQVAILAVGLIEKKPAVIETLTGDAIVVRHKMFLSLSYDHRVVDGMLGGKFLRRIADLLEQFDIDREF